MKNKWLQLISSSLLYLILTLVPLNSININPDIDLPKLKLNPDIKLKLKANKPFFQPFKILIEPFLSQSQQLSWLETKEDKAQLIWPENLLPEQKFFNNPQDLLQNFVRVKQNLAPWILFFEAQPNTTKHDKYLSLKSELKISGFNLSNHLFNSDNLNQLPSNLNIVVLAGEQIKPSVNEQRLLINALKSGKKLLWLLGQNFAEWPILLEYLGLEPVQANLTNSSDSIKFGCLEPSTLIIDGKQDLKSILNLSQLAYMPKAVGFKIKPKPTTWTIDGIPSQNSELTKNLIRVRHGLEQAIIIGSNDLGQNEHILNHGNYELIFKSLSWLENPYSKLGSKPNIRPYLINPNGVWYYKFFINIVLPCLLLGTIPMAKYYKKPTKNQ